jgi:hypothetical protein
MPNESNTTAPRRFANAIAIQLGACNPSGICHSILEACQEIRASDNPGTSAICTDPAVRLMVHQLAFLCNVAEIDDSLDVYGKLTDECRAEVGHA